MQGRSCGIVLSALKPIEYQSRYSWYLISKHLYLNCFWSFRNAPPQPVHRYSKLFSTWREECLVESSTITFYQIIYLNHILLRFWIPIDLNIREKFGRNVSHLYKPILEHINAPPQIMRDSVIVSFDEFLKDLELNTKLMKIFIFWHITTHIYSLLEPNKEKHLMI